MPLKKRAFKFVSALVAGALLLGAASASAETAAANTKTSGKSGSFVSSKFDASVPSWAVKDTHKYSYDFTETSSSFYNNDGGFKIFGTGFSVRNGVLTCGLKKNLALISRGYLGDDYGIGGGDLSFKMKITGGSLGVVLRDTKESPTRKDTFLNFDFNADGTVDCGDYMAKQIIKGAVKNAFSSGEVTVTFEDHVNYIRLLIDGNPVLTVDYIEKASENAEFSVSNYESRIVFRDKDANVLGTQESSQIQRAGCFLITFDDFDGYIDDLSFDRTEIDQTLPDAEQRDIDYSNWVAADDLGRVTPLHDETGGVKEDRCVGMFYFIHCFGAGLHIQDHTKLFLDLGIDGFKKYLSEKGGEGYWAEPYFGYYKNTDTWIYRKHAYMLESLGVDFIFIDITNGVIFDNAQILLFDTWLKIRREGGSTPDICFICGDNPELVEKDLTQMRKTGVFTEENLEKYDELFFKWNGKPLLFANTEGLSRSNQEFIKNYEVRGCWAWQNRDGYWNWIEELNKDANGNLYMYKGRDINGVFESYAVTLGNHASVSKGRSFVLGKQNTNGLQNFEFYLDTTPKGLCFASQAEFVLKNPPRCVMITGWNEWIAGNMRGSNFMANTPVDNVLYVDGFNPEFSRDGEPMKIRDGVGFGDNYYYQIADFIRRYKGMGELKKASGQENFDGEGAMNTGSASFDTAWENVGPEYRDNIGDVEFRNTVSYDAAFRFLNGTGRNDLESAKVSRDADYVYFTVKTVNAIETADDTSWMNLFIDTDFNHETGWEGYDYVINRSRDGRSASVEKLENGSFEGTAKGTAEIAFSGNRFTVKIAKSILGLTESKGINFDFKWADNSTETGNVMSFMDLGDTAPNDRFNFRFVGDSVKYEEKIKETEKPAGSKKGCGGFAAGAGALALAAAMVAVMPARKKKKDKKAEA